MGEFAKFCRSWSLFIGLPLIAAAVCVPGCANSDEVRIMSAVVVVMAGFGIGHALVVWIIVSRDGARAAAKVPASDGVIE